MTCNVQAVFRITPLMVSPKNELQSAQLQTNAAIQTLKCPSTIFLIYIQDFWSDLLLGLTVHETKNSSDAPLNQKITRALNFPERSHGIHVLLFLFSPHNSYWQSYYFGLATPAADFGRHRTFHQDQQWSSERARLNCPFPTKSWHRRQCIRLLTGGTDAKWGRAESRNIE